MPEKRLGFFFLSDLRVGVGEQSSRAMKIVVRIFANHSFKVGQRRCGFA
jgi:hypothetical protein